MDFEPEVAQQSSSVLIVVLMLQSRVIVKDQPFEPHKTVTRRSR